MQVDAANRAYNKLHKVFLELKEDNAEFKSSITEKFISEILAVRKKIKDLISATIEADFLNEHEARAEAINKLRSNLIQFMDKAFAADFERRIPAALQLIQSQLADVKNQLEFTFTGADKRITALEEEISMLKEQCTETKQLLVVYAHRLDQLE